MVESLIYLNNKHISVNQLQMAEDRILQCHIRNLPSPPPPLIETYLKEVDFLHAALLGLHVDGSVVTESIQSADWGTVCYDLFGVVLEMIYGGRIEMAWLRNNFAELQMILLKKE
ncbi:hypothetical protein J1N35_039639 [Gossypium stocksii]|uniref:Uncharacterized protein n=1 Tax=Gossypium stocksii TaxID=47602 RepID=A0A9D3UC78_9ROSI|nr:hypothetical protein J1N35_039639 [Gossypium stocksii]